MVEAAAVVFMVAVEAAVFMVAAADITAAAEASMVAAHLMAGPIEGFALAASKAARDLLAEEVTTRAAGWEVAAVQPRREIGRRMFVPQSTMANGIHSATHKVPPVPAEGATPEAWRTQTSLLATPEVSMAVGILLARLEALPVSAADLSAGRPASVVVVMVGEAVGEVTVGEAGGAGEVGASASAGPTGAFIGDRRGRLAGILGGTALTDMALTGTARGRPTLTIRITATTGPTIRRRTDRIHTTTVTRRQTS
jgi:hypothetical protein